MKKLWPGGGKNSSEWTSIPGGASRKTLGVENVGRSRNLGEEKTLKKRSVRGGRGFFWKKERE